MTTSPLLDPLDHVFTDQQKHQDAHDSRGALPQRDTLSPAELLPGMTSCVKQKRKLFLGRLPAAVAWFGLLRPVIGVSHRGCRDRSGNKVPVPFRQTLKPISSLEHTSIKHMQASASHSHFCIMPVSDFVTFIYASRFVTGREREIENYLH